MIRKPQISLILSLAAFGILGCNHSTSTDIVDSAKNKAVVAWTPISPDTAAMKNWKRVEIITNFGRLEVALFDATPLHRDNFLKLASSGFYHGMRFHRIIQDFMIQAGDPKTKNQERSQWGKGEPDNAIPAEILDTLFHYRGALAAARSGGEDNPKRASNSSQFYIVWGGKYDEDALRKALSNRVLNQFLFDPDNLSYRLRLQNYQQNSDQPRMNEVLGEIYPQIQPIVDSLYKSMPERARQMYATWGGYPALDKEYTIFGFLVEGYSVLEKIQATGTDKKTDIPNKDVKILSTKVLN